MTDPRLTTIRAIELALLAMLVAWLWPAVGVYLYGSFALAPLGLFMPVFLTVTNTCPAYCSATGSVTMTFGGVANRNCSTCSDWNTSVVKALVACGASVGKITTCGISNGTLTGSVTVGASGSNTTVSVQFAGPSGCNDFAAFPSQSIGATPADCSSFAVSWSSPGLFGLVSDCCDLSSISCSAVA